MQISRNISKKIVSLAARNRQLSQENMQLMMECDDKQALIEALEAQVIGLGGIPTKHSWLDKPWTGEEIEGTSVMPSIDSLVR